MRLRKPVIGAVVALSVLALLNGSAGAPAARLAPVVYVFPIPGGHIASPRTQISFRGVTPAQLGTIHVTGSQSGNHGGHVAVHSDGNGGSFIPDSKFTPHEVVTVTAPALNIEGAGSSYAFTVADPAPGFRTWAPPKARRVRGDVWRFRSYP